MKKIAIIEMVERPPKAYLGLKRLINYIYNPEKTTPEISGGLFCTPKFAYDEFIANKELYNKTMGIQGIHFVQSFPPNEVTPEVAKKVAEKLLEFHQFQNFQVAYAVHTDKDHIHTHFVINSVGLNGKKWQQGKNGAADLRDLKNFSDDICRSFGLSVCERKHRGHKKSGEYRLGSQSYKYELYLAVLNAKKKATSFKDFRKKLELIGYKMRYSKNKKYITFTTPDNRKIRNKNIYPAEAFTYEEIQKELKHNRETFTDNDKETNDKFFEYVKLIAEEEKFPLSHIIATKTDFLVYGEKVEEYKKLYAAQLAVDEKASLYYLIPNIMKIADGKEKFIELFKKFGFDVEFTDKEITFKSDITGYKFKNTELKLKKKFDMEKILQAIELFRKLGFDIEFKGNEIIFNSDKNIKIESNEEFETEKILQAIELFNKIGFDAEFKDNEIKFNSKVKVYEFKNMEFESNEEFETEKILQAIEYNKMKKETAYAAVLTSRYSLSFKDFISKMKELNIEVNIDDKKAINFKIQNQVIEGKDLYQPKKFTYETLKEKFEENKQKIVSNGVFHTIVTAARMSRNDKYPVSSSPKLCNSSDVKSYRYRYEESENLYVKNLKGYLSNAENERDRER